MAIKPEQIRPGGCYSNGEFGQKWTVWQIAEISFDAANVEVVRYRILVGSNRRKYQTITREEFTRLVRYEVELMESTWQRVV